MTLGGFLALTMFGVAVPLQKNAARDGMDGLDGWPRNLLDPGGVLRDYESDRGHGSPREILL